MTPLKLSGRDFEACCCHASPDAAVLHLQMVLTPTAAELAAGLIGHVVLLLGPVALALDQALPTLPTLTTPATQLVSSSCPQLQSAELHVQPDCPDAELCGQAI